MVAKGKVLVGAVAAAAVMVRGIDIAAADLWRETRYTYGGLADCTVETFDDQGARDSRMVIRCNIDDTANDGDSIYVDWAHDGFPVNRMEAPADQDAHLLREGFGDLIIREIRWRVCKNDFPLGDPCSEWAHYYPAK